MSKISKVISLVLLATMLLSACGGQKATEAPAATQAPPATEAPAVTQAPGATEAPAATQAPTTAPSGNKVQITLATWAGADEAKELQAVIELLEQLLRYRFVVTEPLAFRVGKEGVTIGRPVGLQAGVVQENPG